MLFVMWPAESLQVNDYDLSCPAYATGIVDFLGLNHSAGNINIIGGRGHRIGDAMGGGVHSEKFGGITDRQHRGRTYIASEF